MMLLARQAPPVTTPHRSRHATATLAAAVLGFFVVTLDAVVVNVALPSIRADLGGGITGLQWVVDGYTLLFAALLLSAGAFSDRAGARRAFNVGTGLFAAASAACGLAPALGALVAARFVQGAAAAVIMPSSMALIGQGDRAGTASGVFNTGRQVGGALAVAVFGALLAHQGTFTHGLRVSLLIAAAVALAAAVAAAALHTPRRTAAEDGRVSGGAAGRAATAAAGPEIQEKNRRTPAMEGHQ
jgi:MFS transporter, DHA2 family, methylenomycin A resistance protein